jgi:hypothetical protein
MGIVGFDTKRVPVLSVARFINRAAAIGSSQQGLLIRLHHTGLPQELALFLKILISLKLALPFMMILSRCKNSEVQPDSICGVSNPGTNLGAASRKREKIGGPAIGDTHLQECSNINWEAPTLTEKQIDYAATDAWVCLEIYSKLLKVKSYGHIELRLNNPNTPNLPAGSYALPKFLDV